MPVYIYLLIFFWTPIDITLIIAYLRCHLWNVIAFEPSACFCLIWIFHFCSVDANLPSACLGYRKEMLRRFQVGLHCPEAWTGADDSQVETCGSTWWSTPPFPSAHHLINRQCGWWHVWEAGRQLRWGLISHCAELDPPAAFLSQPIWC